jgi:hypothetical protein
MGCLKKTVFCCLVGLICTFIVSPSWAQTPQKKNPGRGFPVIDGHNHLHGGMNQNYTAAAAVAVKKMDVLGISKMIVMPPPGSPGHRGVMRANLLLPVIRKYPDRFAFMGGGGELNVMIHKEKHSRTVSGQMAEKFRKTAQKQIDNGAIGFGEFAVEHFSFSPTHPYESVTPDHPLLLLLADIAGRHKMPVDIHMEAVSQDIPFPTSRFLDRSPHNPGQLKENMTAFERLVSHNPDAKILWSHVGWCNTGHRTVQLCRDLLSRHGNLYMSFKFSPEGKEEVRPLGSRGAVLKPEWLQLIRDFPDRFIIGTDQFYGPPGSKQIGPQKTEAMIRFIDLLPPDLAKKLCWKNPKSIFNL